MTRAEAIEQLKAASTYQEADNVLVDWLRASAQDDVADEFIRAKRRVHFMAPPELPKLPRPE